MQGLKQRADARVNVQRLFGSYEGIRECNPYMTPIDYTPICPTKNS